MTHYLTNVCITSQDLRSEFVANSQLCASTFNVPAEELTAMRAAKDKTTFQPSDNLKDYIKCVIGKSGFIVPGGEPNWERVVSIATAIGYTEASVRENVEKCKSRYTGSHTASDAWSGYSCVFSL